MIETYPGGSVSVRNSRPELRDLQRGYAARLAPPGVPGKESARRGQAGDLGRWHFGPKVCQLPPFTKHCGASSEPFPPPGDAVTGGSDRTGAACHRLRKMV